MKANEAPEKLYMPFEDEIDRDCLNTYAQKNTYHKEIEYTRTDAFIEKACDAYCKICKMPNCRSNECEWLSDFKVNLETI